MSANDKSPATAHAIDQAFTRASPYGTQAEPTYSGALSFLRRRYTKDLTGVDVFGCRRDCDHALMVRSGRETI